jgi:hypothetical protein
VNAFDPDMARNLGKLLCDETFEVLKPVSSLFNKNETDGLTHGSQLRAIQKATQRNDRRSFFALCVLARSRVTLKDRKSRPLVEHYGIPGVVVAGENSMLGFGVRIAIPQCRFWHGHTDPTVLL